MGGVVGALNLGHLCLIHAFISHSLAQLQQSLDPSLSLIDKEAGDRVEDKFSVRFRIPVSVLSCLWNSFITFDLRSILRKYIVQIVHGLIQKVYVASFHNILQKLRQTCLSFVFRYSSHTKETLLKKPTHSLGLNQHQPA